MPVGHGFLKHQKLHTQGKYTQNRGAQLQRNEYSAGAVKLSFWFAEFKKIIAMLHEGKSMEEIKTLAEEENIFSAATQARSKQMFTTVSMRVSRLSDIYHDIFLRSTHETQKLINLISIMNTDTLFFDFMNEIYREKLVIGDTVLTDMDLRVFFHNKQEQSEKVAKWTEETIERLQKSYKSWLTEAGLLDQSQGDRKIIRPFIDYDLEAVLKNTNMKPILDALSGTR